MKTQKYNKLFAGYIKDTKFKLSTFLKYSDGQKKKKIILKHEAVKERWR